MFNLNLLPWRQMVLFKKQKQFIYAVLWFSIFYLLLLGFAEAALYIKTQKLLRIAQPLRQVQVEINDLKKIIKSDEVQRKNVQQRLVVMQNIHKSQQFLLYFMTLLTQVTPEAIYLTQWVFEPKQILLQGVSQDEMLITTYLNELQRRIPQRKIQLKEIQAHENRTLIHAFVIRVR